MTEAAFFYGTLMATEIIGDGKVLCGRSASPVTKEKKLNTLQLKQATLIGYRRYALKHATYPGMLKTGIPSDQVHGILCCGLTLHDVEALDDYEGDEYERRTAVISKGIEAEAPNVKQMKDTSCQVYIWTAGNDKLKDHDWDYEHWRQHHLPHYDTTCIA